MSIQLYNSLTRAKQPLAPLTPGQVLLYTCGPTVYNYAHIGNLRTYLFEDILVRALKMDGLDVRRVMNVTDVGHLTDDADAGEDKMERGAQREGRSVWDIAAFYEQAFRDDLDRLNCLPPDLWCRATENIDAQKKHVETLAEKGYTYIIEGDGIYFDTSRLADYGKLARLDIENLRAGARIEMAAEKRNITDFAVWKFSPRDRQRLMEWDNPCRLEGKGFPGWHIECSAMAIEHLGERLDIHCGGIDHIPVHHTNEIAQAEAALGHPWCNVWLHGEFLTLPKSGDDGGKMSKSSGEFLTLKLLTEKGYDPLAYRYFCLNAHYRQQLTFTWDALDAAAAAYKRLKRTVLELREDYSDQPPIETALTAFRSAVLDDLNMPQALAAMWTMLRDQADQPAGQRYATLLAMDEVLALGIADMQPEQAGVDEAKIRQLIDDRQAARAEKDYARADAIRDELDAMGIELLDSAEGTSWRVK